MDFSEKRILGMIHLAGPDAVDKAMEEIRIYDEEGLYGYIVENYHGSIKDVEALLERIKYESPTSMKLGINILPNEYKTALDLAVKYGADFIQLDYVSGNYIGCEPFDWEGYGNYAADFYRHHNITVLGGVWPKYYTPIVGSILTDDILQGLNVADGIVVTGDATGSETPIEKIKEFREIIDYDDSRETLLMDDGTKKPLIVGAGVTPLNVAEQLEFAQGAIVGSAFKPRGRTFQMVDRELVKTFMNEVNKI